MIFAHLGALIWKGFVWVIGLHIAAYLLSVEITQPVFWLAIVAGAMDQLLYGGFRKI